jgi:hypothetical protein
MPLFYWPLWKERFRENKKRYILRFFGIVLIALTIYLGVRFMFFSPQQGLPTPMPTGSITYADVTLSNVSGFAPPLILLPYDKNVLLRLKNLDNVPHTIAVIFAPYQKNIEKLAEYKIDKGASAELLITLAKRYCNDAQCHSPIKIYCIDCRQRSTLLLFGHAPDLDQNVIFEISDRRISMQSKSSVIASPVFALCIINKDENVHVFKLYNKKYVVTPVSADNLDKGIVLAAPSNDAACVLARNAKPGIYSYFCDTCVGSNKGKLTVAGGAG